MTLPRSIPTREIKGHKFLTEIDFFEYKKRLPQFVGQEGYEKPTAENMAKRIPRVVGFLDEIAEAQEILTSSMTNSVFATGEEGVGKSALLLGLLNKVALGDVAPTLLAKRYFIFNLHEFFKLSPADQVSQFDASMDYMSKINSLVIIDRIDDFVANSGPDRARRLMSSLINALENERVSALITAQTGNRQSIDQTSTLFCRVFKELPIEERTPEEVKSILRQAVPRFEKRHKVVIGEDVVTEILRLDQRYEGRLKGQSPNRLVEFLDQLAASVNITKYGKPIELLKQEMNLVELLSEEEVLRSSVHPSLKKIAEVRERIKALEEGIKPQLDAWAKKFGAIRQAREDLLEARNTLAPLQEKFEKYIAAKDKEALRRQQTAAAKEIGETIAPLNPDELPQPLTEAENKTRDDYMKAEKAIKTQLDDMEKDLYVEDPHVTVADTQARFSKVTGVTGATATNDAARLLGIENKLGENVFGQDRAKHIAANTYRIREAGTSDPSRPAGVIMFTGAPGCGKTELIERLAQIDGSELISYNMSEYTDASSVSKLVGAAPGLVGFGEVKTLPTAVREKPKSIVFFDEIEKAHPNMQRAIMQLMDKGKMNDEYGRTVSFKDCIVFMATNVLYENDFTPAERRDDKIVRAKLKEKKNPLTGEPYFLPEVIGRVDAVDVFDNVTQAIAKMILFKNIRDVNNGIASRGYRVQLDDADADRILDAYFDPTQGGRSVKQLSNTVLRPLATQRMLTRQASEPVNEDDELKPMALTIMGRDIFVDGVTLEREPISDIKEPARPEAPAVPAFKEAAVTVAGGPTS